MGLQGTLDTMSVAELMQWFTLRPRTGVLKLKARGRTKTLMVEEGRVINAGSTDPREYLGQFLINLGLIDEDELQKAFETQLQTRVLLGKILVMTGRLTEVQVLRVLELKIRESILDAFLWDAGGFEFIDGVLPEETSVIPVALELKILVQEGVQRREQAARIRKGIPSDACCFRVTPAAAGLQVPPTSTTGVMLGLAGQGLSVADITLHLHSPDFPVLRVLYDLLQRGLLEVLPPGSAPAALPVIELDLSAVEGAPAGGPEATLATAEQAMQAGDLEGAVRTLEAALSRDTHSAPLAAALERAEAGLLARLRAELRADTSTPVPQARDELQATAKWTPAERYLLERADGRRTLKAILQVSPLREIDALRTIRELVRRGLLGLRG